MKTPWRTALTVTLWALASAVTAAPTKPAAAGAGVCSWDHPGQNPFVGDVVQAVDRYRDISPAVRERLKARMEKRQYDEIVTIRRNSIDGHGSYQPAIRDMHFGPQSMCRTVTRDKWSEGMEERGLVYCESGECILVPTVCRNVSRITRNSDGGVTDPEQALAFAPPGAGPGPEGGSFSDGAGPVGGGGTPGAGPLAAAPAGDGSGGGAGGSPGGSGGGGGPAFGPGGGPGNPGPFAPPSIGPLLPPTPAVPLPVPEPAGWLLGIASVLALLFGRRIAARLESRSR